MNCNMQHSHRYLVPAMTAVLIAALCALVALNGCSTTPTSAIRQSSAEVPAELRVDGPIAARVHATGFQVYVWQEDGAGGPGWKLKAPDAVLSGDFSGTHSEGPKWAAADGSWVTGHRIADHPAEGDAVAWLLLEANGNSDAGLLSTVTFIQRLNTTGGKAPAKGGAKAGEEVHVPYSADYAFYAKGAARASK
jgi:hypothetical protein